MREHRCLLEAALAWATVDHQVVPGKAEDKRVRRHLQQRTQSGTLQAHRRHRQLAVQPAKEEQLKVAEMTLQADELARTQAAERRDALLAQHLQAQEDLTAVRQEAARVKAERKARKGKAKSA